jgi:hypothetical protein
MWPSQDIDILKTPVETTLIARGSWSVCDANAWTMLILSERHLWRIVTEYVTYFNRARPHQGIHQRIPCDPQLPDHPDGEMVGVPVLGGLHHDYRRKAA